MNVISWVLFGLLVGLVANILDPAPNRGGLLSAIILGIVGALVGGFLATLLFGISITGFDLTSFAVAVLGALIVLYLGRAMRSGSM